MTEKNLQNSENEFLSILAHELRNPLANILSTVELAHIENISENPAIEGHVSTITHEVKHIMRILDRLLDASRISRRKSEKLNLEPVPLQRVLEEAAIGISKHTHFSHHSFECTYNPEVIMVLADMQYIAESIVLFFKHCMRQAPSGAMGIISIRSEENFGVIEIERKMPQTPQTSLLSARESGVHDAVLFTALHCIERHGGSISHNEHSTSFTLRIPLSKGLNTITTQDAEHGVGQEKYIKSRVLVVDDNIIAASTLVQLLNMRGYHTAVAHSGAQGFERALKFKPDIAILDIGMPDIDGCELVSLLHTELPLCTYIALTGYSQARDKKRALDAGFQYYLTKPSSINDIERLLHDIETKQKNFA